MEVVTGVAISIMLQSTLQNYFPGVPLTESNVRLKTYTDNPVEVTGEVEVLISYRAQNARVTLVIVSGNGPTLLGRNWMSHIRLDCREIFSVRTTTNLNDVLNKHQGLLTGKLGTVKTYQGKFRLKNDAQPRVCKARPVPFAIRDDIGSQLDRLEADGVIETIKHSYWAAPIVPVPKKCYRLCGD